VAKDGGEMATAATALLGALPVEPAAPLHVDVLGSLQVYTGADRTPRPELRRIRVRELLAVLVVEERVSRDRMAELVWGDHHPSAAARNLRVTLSYLRRLLEPDRPPGEASFHLRADTSHISLFRSDHLVVDAWELERLVAEARRARASSDVTATIETLERATALWRGAPLVDLERFDDLAGHAARLRQLHVGALLDLGELQLARGRAQEALANADRGLAIDPYDEQAHRLAMAAALQLRDAARVRSTMDRVNAVLGEIGAAPEPTTAILLQRSVTWMQARG
jgi:DNA-binding SARP family transcriptional activator